MLDCSYCYDFSDLMGTLWNRLLTQHNVLLTIAIYLCGSQFNRGSLSCVRTSGYFKQAT